MTFIYNRVAAHLHTVMSPLFSKVPCKNIGQMGLLTPGDLPLFLLAGPAVSIQTASRLRSFQHNLVNHTWPSLADIYPRPMLWFYAYLLFFWGRYCCVLGEVLDQPDRCLLAEIYLRYICQIDTFLDSFDSRSLQSNIVGAIEDRPEIRTLGNQFKDWLAVLSGEEPRRETISGLVSAFLDHNLLATRRWMTSENMSLVEIQELKKITTGELYLTWSRILGILYHIPEDLAENAASIIYLFGMVFQVVDDISDARQDYLVNSPNTFLGLASENPHEYARLVSQTCSTGGKYMDWPWLKSNVPQTYARAIGLIHSYAQEIRRATRDRQLTGEFISLVARLIAVAGHQAASI